ncbi:conserved hypothetical protein [Vibrio phage 236O40-1]|nr:conserved hypothetical protein [Vibrio phage 236O40-1]
MLTIIRLSLILLLEVFSEYKKSKKQNDIEQLEQDPHGWFSDRFGRVPVDTNTTSETDSKSD